MRQSFFLFLIASFLVIGSMSSCRRATCPAYSVGDTPMENKMKNNKKTAKRVKKGKTVKNKSTGLWDKKQFKKRVKKKKK